MSDRDDLTDLHGEHIATTEARLEGFYWVILGQNPPEIAIAYWERGEWWLAGEAKPWRPEAVTVASDRLVFTAAPEAGRMSHALERMHQERFKAFIEHPRGERDMAEASRRGRLLQSEPEKPLPDVPLHKRGFGVMDEDAP